MPPAGQLGFFDGPAAGPEPAPEPAAVPTHTPTPMPMPVSADQLEVPDASGARRILIECDGGARGNPGPAGIGAVVRDADSRQTVLTVSEYIGETTNNVAEYRALIEALTRMDRRGAEEVEVLADSLLVINQLKGRWRVKQPHLVPLHAQAKELLARYRRVTLRHIPREENTEADALVNEALDAERARRRAGSQ